MSTGVIEEIESEVFQSEEEMAPPRSQPTASETYAAFLKNVQKWKRKLEDIVQIGIENTQQENTSARKPCTMHMLLSDV